jgi:hypothetical protein
MAYPLKCKSGERPSNNRSGSSSGCTTFGPRPFLSAHDPVEVPAVGDTLQPVLTSVFERQPGARDEILDGLRSEHLRRASEATDPRADVYRQAPDFPIDPLDLAGVQTRSDLNSQGASRPQ